MRGVDTIDTILHTVSIWALPVLLAITLHEAAHGWVAYRLGDPTAKQLGRVTFNPIAHIDPVGTIVVPLILYFSTNGSFLFGYARPVPVDWTQLKNPRWDMVRVALAGPAVNFIQAIIWVYIAIALAIFMPEEKIIRKMAEAGVMVNLAMWAFNLFPLPPLDGGRVAVGILPLKLAASLAKLERWGFFIVLALVLAGVLGSIWMRPMMHMGHEILNFLIRPLVWLFL